MNRAAASPPTRSPLLPPAALVLLGTLGLLAAACASGFVAQRPYPAPQPEALLAELVRRQQVVRAVDLETRAESWLGGDRTKATVLMLVDRGPEAGGVRLRLEVEVALQGAVATLVTNAGQFALLDLQAQVFKQGPACADNVGALLPVPLEPAEIAAILLGDAPLTPQARAVAVTWDGKAAADVLEIENRGAGSALTRRLWVSLRPGKGGGPAQAPWQVVAVEAATPAGGRWRVAYADLERPGGSGPAAAYTFPGVIKFAEPGRSFDDGVEIVVKERRVNPELRPQAFQLTAPEGYAVQVVKCCPGCARAP